MKKVKTVENNFLSFKDNTYIVEHLPQNPYFQRERKTLKKIIKTICIMKFFSTIKSNDSNKYLTIICEQPVSVVQLKMS